MRGHPKSHRKLLPFAVSAALGIAGTQVWAQSIEEESVDAGASSASTVTEEVIVTGSRIKRDGYSSPSPVDVITVDQAEVQGIADVGTLLQTSTVASGSPQVTSEISSAFITEGGIGASTISLRGLGANRTLVLINGRRAGPAGVRGQVSSFDLNLIPLTGVERVDVLKDGASTMYGSDAIAGVVNIVTRKDDGLSVDVFHSTPAEGDGEQSRLSLRWGKTFDKGHFSIMADAREQSELRKGDRDYFDCGEQYVFDPVTGERADLIDPRTGKPHCNDLLWGHVWVYDYSGQPSVRGSTVKAQYDYEGDLGNYIPGFDGISGDMETPDGWYPVAYDYDSFGVANADHPFQDGSSLIPDYETQTLYADASYDLTDTMTLYAEALYSRRETYVNGYRQFWTYIYNSNFDFYYFYTTPFAGSDLSEGWTGSNWLSPTPITDHSDNSVEVTYGRALVGLEGQAGDYNWDLSFQYSKSDGEYLDDQIYYDAIASSYFAYGSCEGLLVSQTYAYYYVDEARDIPCHDVDWLDQDFMAGNISPEDRAFLFGTEKGTTEYTQWSLEGTVSGPLFDLPAGEVLGAIGFQYRDDEIRDVPGPITRAGNSWGASRADITAGSDSTVAVFGEIELPLVQGAPMMESLLLNASMRYTDVDSYGGDTTWKLGVNWELTPTVRVRASSGTSFRTPALFEQYLGNQTSFGSQRSDPCRQWGAALAANLISQRIADNCAADGVSPNHNAFISSTIISSGGLDTPFGRLSAETSTAKTLGVVWRPEFTDLSISADYFDIEINNQVAQLGAGTILYQCYNSEFFPDDPLCDLFERRTTVDNGVDNIRNFYINIASQRNRGWDLRATWATDTPVGVLRLDTQHTFQIEDSVALFADTVRDYNGDLGDPKWTGQASATLDASNWSASWVVNMIGEADNYKYVGSTVGSFLDGPDFRVKLHVPRVFYHNASASYSFSNGLTVRAGVSNVFDQEPPKLSSSSVVSRQGVSAFYSQYDWRGRTFFANLRYEL